MNTETEAEPTHKELLAAYRDRLAQIADYGQINAECIGAVFYGGLAAPMSEDQEVGTILGIQHEQGIGFFGPTVWTKIKLCPACAHRPGGDKCLHPSEVEWRLVMWVNEVRRNGDCCLGESYCDSHSSPLAEEATS